MLLKCNLHRILLRNPYYNAGKYIKLKLLVKAKTILEIKLYNSKISISGVETASYLEINMFHFAENIQ